MILKQRKISILISISLMIAMIIVLHASWDATQQNVKLDFQKEDFSPSIPVEEGVFKRSRSAMNYEKMPNGPSRSLEEYYEGRAFPGAPPIIPHPVLDEKGVGGQSCLQCHQNGGFVSQFKAYAPITPHPEMLSCKQCHVPVKTDLNFQVSEWEKIDHPEIGGSALTGSPPVIPHGLQMRENCLSCHAGPAAPNEIRVSHPMRINCRQCHVPVENFNFIQWDSTVQFTRKSIK